MVLIKKKKRIKQVQGVHDGEHKKKQQTTTKIKISSLGDNTKRRKKLNDGRTSQRAPAPSPIKQSTLA